MVLFKKLWGKLFLNAVLFAALFLVLLPAGKASASAYMYDNTRTPAHGSWTYNRMPTISIQTTTNLSGYSREFIVDGTAVSNNYNGSIISYTPTSNLAGGNHTVTVKFGWWTSEPYDTGG